MTDEEYETPAEFEYVEFTNWDAWKAVFWGELVPALPRGLATVAVWTAILTILMVIT